MSSITIYDVAERAGVAISTVSKVLSGKHKVSDATRERVILAVEELNFVPSTAAQTLAGQSTSLIGLVISHSHKDFFDDPNLLQILSGVSTRVNREDFALVLSMPEVGSSSESAFQRMVRGFRVDGVLVEGGHGEVGINVILKMKYPCVVIGYSQHDLPCVYPDDYGGVRQMTKHLLGLEHRRIGVITNPGTNLRGQLARSNAYRDCMTDAGIMLDDDLLFTGNNRPESGYEGAGYLMSLERPPTAIFAFNDRMAMGAMRWLRENGYSVPDDVSVCGFDDIADAKHMDPPLTTIAIGPAKIGFHATNMLFKLIAGEDMGLKEMVLRYEFKLRGSTAPPRQQNPG